MYTNRTKYIRLTTTFHLTLMMTSVQVVETSVTTTDNSPSQDYTHPDDQTTLLHVTPGFKPFTVKKTLFGAHLWMYFSSINRSCFKLFLFSTVLLNITLLKMGFFVDQWENENSISVVNEKKVVGAVKLKEGTISSWHIDWFKQRSSGHL